MKINKIIYNNSFKTYLSICEFMLTSQTPEGKMKSRKTIKGKMKFLGILVLKR